MNPLISVANYSSIWTIPQYSGSNKSYLAVNPGCKTETTHLKRTINLKVLGILLKIFGPNWRCSLHYQQAAAVGTYLLLRPVWLSCRDFPHFRVTSARAQPETPDPAESRVTRQEVLTRDQPCTVVKPKNFTRCTCFSSILYTWTLDSNPMNKQSY